MHFTLTDPVPSYYRSLPVVDIKNGKAKIAKKVKDKKQVLIRDFDHNRQYLALATQFPI